MARRRSSSEAPAESSAVFIRICFAIEALSLLILGGIMVFYPKQILSWASPKTNFMHLVSNPSTWQPAPQAAILLQYLGALILVVITPLVSGITNGPGAVYNRQQAYKSILVGEVAICGAMVWQLMTSQEISRAVSDRALIWSAGVLAAPLLFRVYCLVINPAIFGGVKGGDVEKKA